MPGVFLNERLTNGCRVSFTSQKKIIALPRNTHWKVLLNIYISFNDRTQHNFLDLLGYEAVVLERL
ncbi:MAG: hypothetical protein CVT99_12430 [Bacteroidetes bacterium HGW-Bacteroidetes-16]|nr:MAG: hypothetical protein CVT99_12430 [Bacteroidetes bacterium HGW-Bacteroidetes-16]